MHDFSGFGFVGGVRFTFRQGLCTALLLWRACGSGGGKNVCFLSPDEDMVELERELQRTVVVLTTGNRPAVDLADPALAIIKHCVLEEGEFSIHASAPEDFVLLCV